MITMIMGLVFTAICVGVMIVTFFTGTATERVPSPFVMTIRSLLNLCFNLSTVGAIVGVVFALLHIPVCIISVLSVAYNFNFTIIEIAGAIFNLCLALAASLLFVKWAFTRCYYKTPSNTVTLTQDIIFARTTRFSRVVDATNGKMQRKIAMHSKYGMGFAIAKWTEDYITEVSTALQDPIEIESTFTVLDDSAIVKIIIRYHSDYRRLDWFVIQGKDNDARFNNIAKTLDDEISARAESILADVHVLDAIRDIPVDREIDGVWYRDKISLFIIGEYLGEETSDAEWYGGFQVSGVTYTVNQSKIRESSHAGKGAAKDARDAVLETVRALPEGMNIGEFNESLALQLALSGTNEGITLSTTGQGGGGVGMLLHRDQKSNKEDA